MHDFFDADPDRTVQALTARSLGSAFWLTLQNVLAAILLVALPAVLARRLTPEELGLLEIALAFFGITAVFLEMGTGPAIIQRPAVDATFLSTVFWVNVVTGVAFAGGLAVGAPAIAAWLRMDGQLIVILRWLAAALLPLSTAIVPRNLLARRLLYRRIAFADGFAGAAAAVAGFLWLPRGLDAALCVAFVTYGTLVATVLWSGVRWWPSAMPEASSVWPLLKFSLSISGSKLLENLLLQSDRFLIGRYFGAAALGIFGLARTIIRVPLRYLLNVSDQILLPGLATLQADAGRARTYYIATLKAELTILGPAVIFAAVFALEISRLLFGASYDRAALVAQLLAFAAWRHVTGHTTGAVLLAHGRPDLQLRWTVYALALSVMYFVAGQRWGLEGVALAQSVLDLGGWALRHAMANRLMGLSWSHFARALAPAWLVQAVFLVLVVGIRWGVTTVVAGEAAQLAAGLALASFAYAAALRLAMPGVLTTLGRGAQASVSHAVSRVVRPTTIAAP